MFYRLEQLLLAVAQVEAVAVVVFTAHALFAAGALPAVALHGFTVGQHGHRIFQALVLDVLLADGLALRRAAGSNAKNG